MCFLIAVIREEDRTITRGFELGKKSCEETSGVSNVKETDHECKQDCSAFDDFLGAPVNYLKKETEDEIKCLSIGLQDNSQVERLFENLMKINPTTLDNYLQKVEL